MKNAENSSIIKRMPGEQVTLDNRADANEAVNRRVRYIQIVECLKESDKEGMTAKELAFELYKKGYTPNAERNFTAPRLTELSKKGIVEPIGKTACKWTGKTVTVYGLRVD